MPEYFAWLDGSVDDPVRRLVVNQDVSGALEAVLRTGAENLLGTQELIPLSAEPFQPDETEAWIIEGFDFPEVLLAALDNPIGVPQVTREIEGHRVKCLVGAHLGPARDVTAFQVVDRRQLISQKVLGILLDGDVFKRIRDPGILIGEEVHVAAVDRRLVFKSLWWARRVFNLETHYVEATQEQIDAFVQRRDIRIESEDFRERPNQWERKRISYLMQSGLMDQTTPTEVREKAAQYDIDVEVELEDGQEVLVIPGSPTHRKALLKFLEEDYYSGPLTETKYVANSKRRV